MKKKRILILSFILSFLVSTTGLPLTIHFCNMPEKEMSSACPMHMPENKMADMHSDCDKENQVDKTISLEMQDCCKTETIIASVKDSFIANNSESQNNFITGLSLVSELTVILVPQNISIYSFIDTSPPLLQSNHLYLTNSTFLI